MAGRKKQEVAVQIEIHSEEDWDLCLKREGIHVIDVYQPWSGPCQSMVGTLRKLKNELNDPLLHLETVSADAIEVLKKYRGSCEPCWLFITGGKKVAVIRGCNLPLLVLTIKNELELEHKVIQGEALRAVASNIDQDLGEFEYGLENQEDEELAEEMDKRRKSVYETFRRPFTVAIIKPDAMENDYAVDIIEEIKLNNLEIIMEKQIQMDEEQVTLLYPNLENTDIFDDLLMFMTRGLCTVLVLSKDIHKEGIEGVVEEWKALIGPNINAEELAPESIRARYGSDRFMNAVHGSDTEENAEREFKLFFPGTDLPTMTLTKGEPEPTLVAIPVTAINKFGESIMNKIQVAGFEVMLQKQVQLTEKEAQQLYSGSMATKNKDFISSATSTPLMVMCLSRFKAVMKFKDLLGPKSKETIKKVSPYSIRALVSDEERSFNMMHSSTTLKVAKSQLKMFFSEQDLSKVLPAKTETSDVYDSSEEMEKTEDSNILLEENNIPNENTEESINPKKNDSQ